MASNTTTRPEPHEYERLRAYTGKVASLIFDCLGGFEGFILDTEGEGWKFFSRDKEVEELSERAWRERLPITVLFECDEPCHPLGIVVCESGVPPHLRYARLEPRC